MEMIRWNSYFSICPHLSDKSTIKEPTDLLRFPWEEKKKATVIEKPDWDKLNKEIIKRG